MQKSGIIRIKSIFYNKNIAPYIFCLPFVISFFLFFFYPICTSIYMSFMKVITLDNMEFVGLKNYSRLYNEHFLNAIKLSTIYTLSMVILMMVFPVTIAGLLNSKSLRFRNFFRSAIFVPTLTSVIVAGIAFRMIFADIESGFINSIIISLGGKAVPFKQYYWTGILIMVVLAFWRDLGINMVYCLSAMQTIPEELYESARIDGANDISIFRHITIPSIKPILIYILTLTIINGYRMFTEGYVYWNEATPGGNGLTIVRYIYQQAFQKNDMGLGSAIGVVLLFIILTINLIQLTSFGLFRKGDD